jgi:hypothetical protein
MAASSNSEADPEGPVDDDQIVGMAPWARLGLDSDARADALTSGNSHQNAFEGNGATVRHGGVDNRFGTKRQRLRAG